MDLLFDISNAEVLDLHIWAILVKYKLVLFSLLRFKNIYLHLKNKADIII